MSLSVSSTDAVWVTLFGNRLAAALTCGFLSFAASSELLAQGQSGSRNSYTREETREFIDDYTNTLPDRDGYGSDSRRIPAPPSAGIPLGAGPEVKQIRPLIHGFSDAASQLTYAMNDQMSRLPALRALYSDTLTISAEAVGLDRRAANAADPNSLLNEFEQLDADWRELAYRMQGVRGLTQETRDLIANLNDLDQQIRKALNTQPQVNRQDIALAAAGLAGDLQNLMEDIRAGMGRAETSQELLIQTGKARQQVLGIVSTCRDEQIDAGSLAREYKRFEANWMTLSQKLQTQDDRYVMRSLRRISQSNGRIHQLLLLPQVTDKSQLVYLASTLKKDLDEFYSRTPLKLVIHLPRAGQALATADQFRNACDNFVSLVNNGEDQNALIDAFRSIEEANRNFADVFGQLDSDAAIAVLQRIEQSLGTLRTALHLEREDFDRNAAADLAASIENLTENLDLATRQWLTNDPQSFSNACRQEVAAMSTEAVTIHANLVRGVPISQLRREVDDLYERWRTVYRYIVKCQTNDRPVLGRLSGRLTPAMVELRTLVAQPGVEQTAQRPVRR